MLWQRRDEKPAMDLRRLCCVGLCACGAALVVLEVPSLRFILASQAGLAIGWRIVVMPPNILTMGSQLSLYHWIQMMAYLVSLRAFHR